MIDQIDSNQINSIYSNSMSADKLGESTLTDEQILINKIQEQLYQA